MLPRPLFAGESLDNPIGMKIVGYLVDGRPIIENVDGSISVEALITLEVEPGVWMNIPTILRGSYVTPDEALQLARDRGYRDVDTGKALARFETKAAAEKQAKQRTEYVRDEVQRMTGAERADR
jgi:hypothetical protein